ncbi:hypothetical protein CUMW_241820 [Citrus unshiu]|uniref:Uncharacterized protein n=1 Tax=Citrus unshiu TaxID=55188 RepID=A0A2H5QLM1_CITUN|nr:hypothetical protein CUMW_241820 [Citrus unshiu]
MAVLNETERIAYTKFKECKLYVAVNFSFIIINKCITEFHKLSWWEVISINRVRLMAVLKSSEAVHEVKASDGMTCITEEVCKVAL